MKVSDAVQHMTKQYLHRIIDSFTKDITKPDVERSREIVVRNAEELTDARRIRTVLSREELSRSSSSSPEAWQDAGSDRTFDPEVFNITGILDRPTLEQRMRLFM